MAAKNVLRTYRKLAAKYGLRYRIVTYFPQRAYTAKGIFNLVKTHVDHAAHELAHYLVATPAQRRMPEFGLGSTAYFTDADPVDTKDRRQPEKPRVDVWSLGEIEGEASLLGIFIVQHIEGHRAAEDMYQRHTWCVPTALETARDLIEKKLLIWHKGRLTPRCLVKPPRKSEIYAR
jgi:hypothetical protein